MTPNAKAAIRLMYYTILSIYLSLHASSGMLHGIPCGPDVAIIQSWVDLSELGGAFCSPLLSPGVQVLSSSWYASGFYHIMGQYVQWFEAFPEKHLFIYSWWRDNDELQIDFDKIKLIILMVYDIFQYHNAGK